MTTTNFQNGITPVDATWLNDVDRVVYDADGADYVSYTPSGTGATATTVQTKLRESVSVKDFGAVGDGVTDDTAAIQAAWGKIAATGGVIIFPPGNYLISGNCGNGGTEETNISVLAYGATLTMKATTSAYTMFYFRKNMTIEGLTLQGYISSGTGWSDVVPASSFGFRSSSNGASNVTFIDCKASNLPYDGWYIGTDDSSVSLINCTGEECYRNDFAATAGASIEIINGNFGGNVAGAIKNTAIDFETDVSKTINYASVTGTTITHIVSFWAANGEINRAKIDGVTLSGANALFQYDRIKNMDIGAIQFNSGATYGKLGVRDIVSAATLYETGCAKYLPSNYQESANFITYPYNSLAGLTASSGGTNSTENNYQIGLGKGVRLTNTGGGYNIRKQLLTVVENTWYSFGGLMQLNATPTNSSFGFYIEFPTLGYSVVWLQPTELTLGVATFVSASIKIPAGVTSLSYGFGGSGGTHDTTFTDVFFAKGLFGAGTLQIPKITYSTAIPTVGTWAVGDIIYNTAPASAGYIGWVCTVGGTPGTWKTFGLIS